ncbi:hypothetical protein G9A89_004029 [Geosiphon pyriformis]|nr:hypothetical protein G9A89_004029 [Geosiphon pyriformis]
MPWLQNHERDKECNVRTKAASNEKAFASHLGPYLGQMMSQCPPMWAIVIEFVHFWWPVVIRMLSFELLMAGGYLNVELRIIDGRWLFEC